MHVQLSEAQQSLRRHGNAVMSHLEEPEEATLETSAWTAPPG